VDAPVPIRHENLTSAQDCPGFWTRSLDKQAFPKNLSQRWRSDRD
jgi:hypothetical protein